MAKRYYQSKEDRMHEREGMEGRKMSDQYQVPRVAKDYEKQEHYAGMDPRRRQELEDAGMIHEDHRAVANLPQEVMIKPYVHTGPYLPEELDDTIEGVNRQMDYDDGKRRQNFYPKKV